VEEELSAAHAQVARLSSASRTDAAARIEEAVRARLAAEAGLERAQVSQHVLLAGQAAVRRSQKARDAARARVDELQKQVRQLEDDDEDEGDEGDDEAEASIFQTKRDTPGKGGRSWPWQMDDLVMEQLSADVPPSAIPTAIYGTARRLLHGNMEGISVPSVSFCRSRRRLLRSVTETLAAYRVAKMTRWRHVGTDGTSRRQIGLQNVVISGQYEDDGPIVTVCVRIFIPEGGTAEQACRRRRPPRTLRAATAASLPLRRRHARRCPPLPEPASESRPLLPQEVEAIVTQVIKTGQGKLKAWREKTKDLYPGLKHGLPLPSEFTLAKLGGGGAASTDTCNQAQKLRRLLRAEVAKAVEEQCGDRWATMSEKVAAPLRRPATAAALFPDISADVPYSPHLGLGCCARCRRRCRRRRTRCTWWRSTAGTTCATSGCSASSTGCPTT
jgi:hypothetical protein